MDWEEGEQWGAHCREHPFTAKSVCWSKDRKRKGNPAFSHFCGAPISLQQICKDIGVDYFCTQVCALPVYVHSLHFIFSARLLQNALKTKHCVLKCHWSWSVVCISALSLGFWGPEKLRSGTRASSGSCLPSFGNYQLQSHEGCKKLIRLCL